MIDFDKMKAVADSIETTDSEGRIDIIRQKKHEYILAMVSFITVEHTEHLKTCEEEKCDWCEFMCNWLEHELYNTRIEAHANVIMNLAVNNVADIWPMVDPSMKEAIDALIPQIKAQISQGGKEGVVKLERTPPKGKHH